MEAPFDLWAALTQRLAEVHAGYSDPTSREALRVDRAADVALSATRKIQFDLVDPGNLTMWRAHAALASFVDPEQESAVPPQAMEDYANRLLGLAECEHGWQSKQESAAADL